MSNELVQINMNRNSYMNEVDLQAVAMVLDGW
jgi:hypothetical protein